MWRWQTKCFPWSSQLSAILDELPSAESGWQYCSAPPQCLIPLFFRTDSCWSSSKAGVSLCFSIWDCHEISQVCSRRITCDSLAMNSRNKPKRNTSSALQSMIGVHPVNQLWYWSGLSYLELQSSWIKCKVIHSYSSWKQKSRNLVIIAAQRIASF